MNNTITIELTQNELAIVGNILNKALGGAHPIEDWEFQTLIGATKEEAQELHKRLIAEYGENYIQLLRLKGTISQQTAKLV